MTMEEFVRILACPIDKQPVRLEGQWIICMHCDAHYPIRDEIPRMLIEEAQYPNGKKAPTPS